MSQEQKAKKAKKLPSPENFLQDAKKILQLRLLAAAREAESETNTSERGAFNIIRWVHNASESFQTLIGFADGYSSIHAGSVELTKTSTCLSNLELQVKAILGTGAPIPKLWENLDEDMIPPPEYNNITFTEQSFEGMNSEEARRRYGLVSQEIRQAASLIQNLNWSK